MPDIPTYSPLDGFLAVAGQSFAYTLLQAPIDSINQLAKHSVGTENLVDLHIVSEPSNPPNYGSEMLGKMVGNALGAVPAFVLMNRLAGSAISRVAGVETAASLPVVARMAGAGAAGFSYDAVFHPVTATDEKNFWKIKGSNAATSAITFSAMEGISGGSFKVMDKYLPQLGEDQRSLQVDRILKKAMASSFAGFWGGYIATNTNVALSGKPFSWQDLNRNKNEYFMLATGAAGLNGVLGVLTRKAAAL